VANYLWYLQACHHFRFLSQALKKHGFTFNYHYLSWTKHRPGVARFWNFLAKYSNTLVALFKRRLSGRLWRFRQFSAAAAVVVCGLWKIYKHNRLLETACFFGGKLGFYPELKFWGSLASLYYFIAYNISIINHVYCWQQWEKFGGKILHPAAAYDGAG